jgi:hypothetical protein
MDGQAAPLAEGVLNVNFQGRQRQRSIAVLSLVLPEPHNVQVMALKEGVEFAHYTVRVHQLGQPQIGQPPIVAD